MERSGKDSLFLKRHKEVFLFFLPLDVVLFGCNACNGCRHFATLRTNLPHWGYQGWQGREAERVWSVNTTELLNELADSRATLPWDCFYRRKKKNPYHLHLYMSFLLLASVTWIQKHPCKYWNKIWQLNRKQLLVWLKRLEKISILLHFLRCTIFIPLYP